MQSSSIEAVINEALRQASTLSHVSLEGEVIITYTWRAEPAAYTLYLTLLHAGRNALLAHTSLASVHILPYREVDRVVAFSIDERDARTVNLAMASSALGIEAVVVGPSLHPAVEETLSSLGVERIIVKSPAPLLTMMAATLYWRPKLMGAREERVKAEVEALDSAVEWVSNRYSRELESLAGKNYESIYYSPTLEAGARYYSILTGSTPKPLDEVSTAKGPLETAAFIAGVDEHNYKDLILSSSLRGVKLNKIVVDTDPVTANIYASILSALATVKVA